MSGNMRNIIKEQPANWVNSALLSVWQWETKSRLNPAVTSVTDVPVRLEATGLR